MESNMGSAFSVFTEVLVGRPAKAKLAEECVLEYDALHEGEAKLEAGAILAGAILDACAIGYPVPARVATEQAILASIMG